MKKIAQYPVMFLFFAFIFLYSAVNLLTPQIAYSEMENRYLDQLPTFSVKGMLDSSAKGFAQKFESYVNDQFFLRNGWITLKSVSEAALGKTENNGVVYGKDGYLFEKYRSYDAERLERNVGLIERFAKQNPKLSIRAMLVPSAYNILTDAVPRGLGNVNQLDLINRITGRLEKSGVLGIDVITPLFEHAGEEIYYRTDHHWTTAGAYLGYEAYVRALGIVPAPLEKMQAHTIENFYGTHYSKAKLFSAKPDVITWYDVPIDSITIEGKPVDGLYDLDIAQKRDKYAMFLRGNHGVTVIENADAPRRSVLVVKDSYANSLVPFLSQSFSRVTVVDLRSLPTPLSDLIAAGNFDEVLILYSFSNLASDTNLPRILY